MINENLKLSGQLNIVLKDKNGNVKVDRTETNLVVQKGLEFIIDRMTGTSKAVMSHMALGSSSTAEAAGQTDLVSILGARETLDSTSIPTATKHKVVFVSTFEAGDATGAVKEAGIFNHGTAATGDMLSRVVFAVVNKAADDTMTVTWTITLSAT
jgi:hypothetical protein